MRNRCRDQSFHCQNVFKWKGMTMQNVSLQQAVKMTEKSESTLRRDVKKGKVSAERDARGHLKFDVSELQRVYGWN